MSVKRIFVTGGNTGIGFALCKQLCSQHGAIVYLGSRDLGKGTNAASEIKSSLPSANVTPIQLDVTDDKSVQSAAATVQSFLPANEKLYAIVNNAGTGFAHGSKNSEVMNTNIYGIKRVCDAFIPLLQNQGARVVNVGSGAGPMFVAAQETSFQKTLCSDTLKWTEIDTLIKEKPDKWSYGFSKALVATYTMTLAKEYPKIHFSSLSPGFIRTKMTEGMGAHLDPDEGTVSLLHCLFAELKPESSGWFYGSDGLRSPLHFLRNPGEPEYDGGLPW